MTASAAIWLGVKYALFGSALGFSVGAILATALPALPKIKRALMGEEGEF